MADLISIKGAFSDKMQAYLLLTVTAWCWGANAILGKVAGG